MGSFFGVDALDISDEPFDFVFKHFTSVVTSQLTQRYGESLGCIFANIINSYFIPKPENQTFDAFINLFIDSVHIIEGAAKDMKQKPTIVEVSKKLQLQSNSNSTNTNNYNFVIAASWIKQSEQFTSIKRQIIDSIINLYSFHQKYICPLYSDNNQPSIHINSFNQFKSQFVNSNVITTTKDNCKAQIKVLEHMADIMDEIDKMYNLLNELVFNYTCNYYEKYSSDDIDDESKQKYNYNYKQADAQFIINFIEYSSVKYKNCPGKHGLIEFDTIDGLESLDDELIMKDKNNINYQEYIKKKQRIDKYHIHNVLFKCDRCKLPILSCKDRSRNIAGRQIWDHGTQTTVYGCPQCHVTLCIRCYCSPTKDLIQILNDFRDSLQFYKIWFQHLATNDPICKDAIQNVLKK